MPGKWEAFKNEIGREWGKHISVNGKGKAGRMKEIG